MKELRLKTLTSFQRYDSLRDASKIWAFPPLWTMGRHCLKSPEKTTVIPPKGLSTFLIFLKLRSMHSNISRLPMVTSSMMSRLVCSIRALVPFFLLVIGRIVLSCRPSPTGTLSLECNVLPPGRRMAAFPVKAVAIAIFPLFLTC